MLIEQKRAKPRVIAYYLPQFYPTQENDEWWGKGFTEWTNVGKAKPLFKGHYQPHVPADLGYYDLRLPEVRIAQADMAREAGIEGFCYWHYWFGNGKRVLDRVFDEVVKTGQPDFPFSLCWANETWKGWAHGVKNKILMEQEYPGVKDYEDHFYALLPALKDERYIKVNGKPLFAVYNPDEIPDTAEFLSTWQKLALQNELSGIHFVAYCRNHSEYHRYLQAGYDGVNIVRIGDPVRYAHNLGSKILNRVFKTVGNVYEYKDVIRFYSGKEDEQPNCYPTLFPNWDHSPRSGKRGFVLHNSTPGEFRKHVKMVLQSVAHKPAEEQLVFIRSWNEWGEGNHMEPDLKYGKGFLEVLAGELNPKL